MNAAHLYVRYVAVSFRGQMQYRASFWMQLFGNLFITATEFLGVWALFTRFGHLNGWTLPEAALLYGMSDVSFAIAEAVPRGFDIFPQYVKSGSFDRMLLRPRSAAFQVLATEFQLMRVGRFAQALVVLVWAATTLGVQFTGAKVALLVFAILGGAALFSGLFILFATLSFWTTEALEVVNIATYGGNYAAQYPLSIYKPWLRHVLTFVIPLATLNFLPAHALLGRVDTTLGSAAWVQWASPAVGFVFLGVCLQFWRLGVRRYTSTGS
jgi:ABC-2 type transport system permease protein